MSMNPLEAQSPCAGAHFFVMVNGAYQCQMPECETRRDRTGETIPSLKQV